MTRLFSAITVRSRIELSWYCRQGVLHSQTLPSGRVGRAMWVTPIERTLGVAGERGPSALHLIAGKLKVAEFPAAAKSPGPTS